MMRARFARGAVCATALGMVCALAAVAAQAATTTVRPRLVETSVTQFATSKSSTAVGVEFKIPKADYTFAAKARLCARNRCKTEVITKRRPATGAMATEYAPNVLLNFRDPKQEVIVKTTLTLGTRRYTYRTKAKDTLSPCVVARDAGSGPVPDC